MAPSTMCSPADAGRGPRISEQGLKQARPGRLEGTRVPTAACILGDMLVVRRARGGDSESIARVHVKAWQVGYKGIVDDGYLAGLSTSERAAQWSRTLAEIDSERFLVVAEVDTTIVGFAGGGPTLPTDEDGTFELYVLYVDPPHWRQGAGGALLDAFVAWAAGKRAIGVVLWVAKDNARARAFYEHRGWSWDGAVETRNILGAIVTECRYRLAGMAPDALP
jgi:GNAT superfamily N-acetyltransferase